MCKLQWLAIEFPPHNRLTLLNQSGTSGFGYKTIPRSSSPFSRGISEILGDTLVCPTPCIFWGDIKKLSEEIGEGVKGLSYHQAGKPQGKLRKKPRFSNTQNLLDKPSFDLFFQVAFEKSFNLAVCEFLM